MDYYLDFYGQPRIMIIDNVKDIDDIWIDLIVVQSRLPEQTFTCDVIYYGEILDYESEQEI